MESFLSKLINWKDFELFVADLYKDAEDVTVSHDVTEKGKSGSKRQIDVLVLVKTKLHTLKILIECKRWQNPVDRQVIDVIAASIEDLGANKAVIFTTKGYEEGALQYARFKNVDLFIIRDINDNEWGAPGRHIQFYTQLFGSSIEQLGFHDVKVISTSGKKNNELILDFNVPFLPTQGHPSRLDLFNGPPELKKGNNLVKLIIEIRNFLMRTWMNAEGGILPPETGGEVRIARNVILDFSNYPYRYAQQDGAVLELNKISFRFTQAVTETKIDWDRAGENDFALIVEDYITSTRRFASKRKDEDKIILSGPIVDSESPSEKEHLKNGSIIKLLSDYYLNLDPRPDIIPISLPDQIVNIEPPPDN